MGQSVSERIRLKKERLEALMAEAMKEEEEIARLVESEVPEGWTTMKMLVEEQWGVPYSHLKRIMRHFDLNSASARIPLRCVKGILTEDFRDSEGIDWKLRPAKAQAPIFRIDSDPYHRLLQEVKECELPWFKVIVKTLGESLAPDDSDEE